MRISGHYFRPHHSFRPPVFQRNWAALAPPAKDFPPIPKIAECGLFGAPERQVTSFGSRI